MLTNKELNEILKFNGNEEEFKKYNTILKEPLNSQTIYYDKEKKQKKYTGNLENNIYKGRGILYDTSGEIIYDGYFKEGKYCGFGKLYNSQSLIYEGFFDNENYNGKGILYKNGKKKFEGYFESGHYNGVGIEYLSNGKKRRKMKYRYGQPLNECYGTLYDENDKEIYTGILKNGIPEHAKLVTIYDNEDNLIYIGDFYSFKYHGEGTIFFEKNNKFYFKGKLREGELVNGILYDLNGNPIYEGSFMNNIPKEGNDIKLYRLNTDLKYEGSIFNYKYNGYGKLYSKIQFYDSKNKDNKLMFEGHFKDGKYNGYGRLYNYDNEYDIYYLYYEGNFVNGIFEEKGIQYYLTGEKYYEGNFKNNKFFSLGVRYYKNKSLKIKGNFKDNNYCEGEYYNPDNILIYNGILINEIPLNSENIILYNDETYKIYEGKIKDGKYSKYGIEYSKYIKDMILYKGFFFDGNYTYLNELNKNTISKRININALLLGSSGNDGKTCLTIRLIEDAFSECSLATIGIDTKKMIYEYNKKKYKIKIFDTAGQERYRAINYNCIKISDIILFSFNLNYENSIDIKYFNNLFDYMDKKRENLIYLIGTKLDITKKYVFNYRKLAKYLFDEGKIDKYFEVSSKSCEGIEQLKNILKIDSASIIDNLDNNKKLHLVSKNVKIYNNLYKYLNN